MNYVMIKLHIIAKNQCDVMLAHEYCEIKNWREKAILWQALKKKYPRAHSIYMYCGGQIVDKYCSHIPSRSEELRKLIAKGRVPAKDLWRLKTGRF